MLHRYLHSTTALCVARVITRKAEVTPDSLVTDNNIQFLAWFGGPLLAAIFALRRRAPVLATSALLAAAGPALASSYSTFQFGFSSSLPFVAGINAGGSVIGYAVGESSATTGYERAVDGTITTIRVEGASITRPGGINRQGVIAGNYCASSSCAHGFLRDPNGEFVSFHPKGPVYTIVTAINDSGAVAGYYENKDHPWHGFVRSPDRTITALWHGFVRSAHGTITSFDPAGAGNIGTLAQAINADGDITGYYYDSSGIPHGFLRTTDGMITSFDVKNAAQTYALGINRKGAIVGYAIKNDGTEIGFERTSGGKIRSLHLKGSQAYGINDEGVITGSYGLHGFVGSLKSGFTSFDPPDSGHTSPTSINDDGLIAGTYIDTSGNFHCFIRVP